ncbi:hypothetical protein FQA39_LY17455 [Lamprigera yunnana]|nr:hypothetical protein FQA39_LY17455 [Lamprigera yunnana]
MLNVVLLICVGVTTIMAACQLPCQCKVLDAKNAAVCTRSNLKAIPRSLDSENEVLDLSHNLITNLPANVFQNADLLNLQQLNLHANEIFEIDEDAFRGVFNLRDLDLSNNKIINLKADTIPRWVAKLNLNGNPLKRLVHFFLTSPLLRYLSVENCEIEEIHDGALQELTGLQELSLCGNKLRHLNESIFKNLRSLKILRLEDNPWECDCTFRKFKDWYYKLDRGTVTCASPKHLKGKIWKKLDFFRFYLQIKIWSVSGPDIQGPSYSEDVASDLSDYDVNNNTEEVESDIAFVDNLEGITAGSNTVSDLYNFREVVKEVGKYVVVKYEGTFYSGKITKILDKGAVISTMQKSLKSWKWPTLIRGL